MSNLILTICSNQKRSNDEAQKYNTKARSITRILPDNMREKLVTARALAFFHITKENREWKFFSTAPSNKELKRKRGPDIFPEIQQGDAVYLSALKRYNGRFYANFQSAIDDDIDACVERMNEPTENHLLIVSGLYGLLTPTELIQDYNCNVPEEPAIKKIWKERDLLTELVIAYMRKCQINRVFDFMAEDSYRHLINWERIERETNCTIFYPVSSSPREGEQIGVNLLPRLGHAAGLLLSEEPALRLSDVHSRRTVGAVGVKFVLESPQWIPAGTSLSKREIYAVWAIRMVATIEKYLENVGIEKKRPYSVEGRIRDFRNEHSEYKEISRHMDAINTFRNEVVHNHEDTHDPATVDKIREHYAKVVKWGEDKGYEEPEDVDY